MFERFFKNRYGYSRWDGSQQIEGLDADDVLKALSDDYLENGNLQQAIKRLMQDGVQSEEGRRTMGLRELMERMRNQRNQQLNRYNMASGVIGGVELELENADAGYAAPPSPQWGAQQSQPGQQQQYPY